VVFATCPSALNEALYMTRRWRMVPNPLLEMVCAENNGDHFGKNLFPILQAERPDFGMPETRAKRF